MNITDNTIIKRNTSLLTSSMDTELVMMSLEKGEYYGLNNIASRIWSLLEEPLSFEKLLETLLDEYEVTKEQCIADILPFLEEMNKKQIIEFDDINK